MADDLLVEDKPIVKEPVSDEDTGILDNLLAGKKYDKVEEDEPEPEPEVELEDKEDDLLADATGDENARGIDLKKIKDKYPDFAKTNDFRELRNAYHREAEYTNLFPTIDDAKEAAENNETFVKLNDALINRGDVTILLDAVKEASPEAAKRLANNFLDAVAKYDTNLYTEVITPVVKRLAKQIYAEGKRYLKRNAESEEGLALVATARNITQYSFNDPDEAEKDDIADKPDPKIAEKEQDLTKREQALRNEKINNAYGLVSSSVDKNLDKQILSGLDPDNKLSEFLRDSLLERIKKDVNGQIDKDQMHIKKMNSLWKRAEQQGYNRESLSSIVSAYLERARPIIPTVRNKYKTAALGKGREKEDNEDVKIPTSGKSGRAPLRDGKVNLRAVDPKKVDYRNTSDEDIFEGKVKLRS